MGQACRADIWSKVGVFAKYAENGNGKRKTEPFGGKKISPTVFDTLPYGLHINHIRISNKEILPW